MKYQRLYVLFRSALSIQDFTRILAFILTACRICGQEVLEVSSSFFALTEGKNSATMITDRITRSRKPTVNDRMFIRSL